MRLPRLRITLRWMMVVVAIAAVLIWGEKMRRLRGVYLDKVAKFGYEEFFRLEEMKRAEALVVEEAGNIAKVERMSREACIDAVDRRNLLEVLDTCSRRHDRAIESLRLCRGWYGSSRQLRLKYERASCFPWQSISFDPNPVIPCRF